MSASFTTMAHDEANAIIAEWKSRESKHTAKWDDDETKLLTAVCVVKSTESIKKIAEEYITIAAQAGVSTKSERQVIDKIGNMKRARGGDDTTKKKRKSPGEANGEGKKTKKPKAENGEHESDEGAKDHKSAAA